MEFAETNTPLVEIAKRTALALAAGLIIGLVLGRYITPSTSQRLLIGIAFSVIAYRTQSIAAICLVPIASVAMSSALLRVAGFLFSYQFNFAWLGAIVVGCGLLITLRWHTDAEKKLQVIDVLLVILLALVLQFLTRQSTWNPREAMALISNTGEDNGTWLDGVASVLRRNAAFVSQGYGFRGQVVAVLVSLLAGATNISSVLGSPVASTAVVTVQVYWLLTALAALLAARVTYRLGSPSVGRSAIGLSVLAAIMTTVFSQGFIAGGHLTAQLSATFLLAALLLLLEKPFSELATSSLAILLLLGAADAWDPTKGVLLLALVGALVAFAPALLSSRAKLLSALRIGGSVSIVRSAIAWGAPVVIGLLVLIVGPKVLQLPGRSLSESFSDLKGLLVVDGGKADVDPLVAILIMFFAVIAAADSVIDMACRRLFGVLLGSCITFPVLLIAYGFAQPPYAPQYAAYKVLYMVCLVVTPISIAGLTLVVKKVSKSAVFAVLAASVVVVMGSATYLEPYPRVKNLLVAPPAKSWVDGAIKELAKNPERLLLCLDTRDQWQGQEARNCSRLFAGIQGKTYMTPYVWLEANICRATSAQVAALPEEFWQNVTILVFDSERLVSTDECDRYGWAGPGLPDDERYPIGVLSGVPWNVVRVIGPDGEEVKKSFAYLGGEVPEEVLDKLEQELIG